jgi:hypothetical protein
MNSTVYFIRVLLVNEKLMQYKLWNTFFTRFGLSKIYNEDSILLWNYFVRKTFFQVTVTQQKGRGIYQGHSKTDRYRFDFFWYLRILRDEQNVQNGATFTVLVLFLDDSLQLKLCKKAVQFVLDRTHKDIIHDIARRD